MFYILKNQNSIFFTKKVIFDSVFIKFNSIIDNIDIILSTSNKFTIFENIGLNKYSTEKGDFENFIFPKIVLQELENAKNINTQYITINNSSKEYINFNKFKSYLKEEINISISYKEDRLCLIISDKKDNLNSFLKEEELTLITSGKYGLIKKDNLYR